MGTTAHQTDHDSDSRKLGYLTVRISDELQAELKKLADNNERSKSAEARLAIRAWLQKETA